jgi:predicted dehydrogenase
MKIGILCPSEIAFRRFLPSLKKVSAFEYAGVAVADKDEWFGGAGDDSVVQAERNKADNFRAAYGGDIFGSYRALLSDPAVECVYIPLPPALHCEWGEKALQSGKHLLLEKPFTDSAEKTARLIAIAREKGLAVHENYMFQYHSQLDFILNEINKKTIGDIRLYRIEFGFPFRGAGDFRYKKSLGGGALLDCGGYVLKLASILLGETARLAQSSLHYKDGFEVDIYGDAVMANSAGVTAHLAFGMDNAYKCDLEVWGSSGTIYANRILTAPDGFEPVITIKTSNGEIVKTLPADDSFKKSIERFSESIDNPAKREYDIIMRQAELVEAFKKRGSND